MMIITLKDRTMIDYVVRTDCYISIHTPDTGKKDIAVADEVTGKKAQYHLREFLKCMDKLERLY